MRLKEIAKVRLSTDPDDFGAYVTDKGTTERTAMLPVSKLIAFEPEDKFKEPQYAKNLARIIQALKSGRELPPILVRRYQGGYQVLDGHHRFKAYKLLGKKHIPCRIIAKSNVKVD